MNYLLNFLVLNKNYISSNYFNNNYNNLLLNNILFKYSFSSLVNTFSKNIQINNLKCNKILKSVIIISSFKIYNSPLIINNSTIIIENSIFQNINGYHNGAIYSSISNSNITILKSSFIKCKSFKEFSNYCSGGLSIQNSLNLYFDKLCFDDCFGLKFSTIEIRGEKLKSSINETLIINHNIPYVSCAISGYIYNEVKQCNISNNIVIIYSILVFGQCLQGSIFKYTNQNNNTQKYSITSNLNNKLLNISFFNSIYENLNSSVFYGITSGFIFSENIVILSLEKKKYFSGNFFMFANYVFSNIELNFESVTISNYNYNISLVTFENFNVNYNQCALSKTISQNNINKFQFFYWYIMI